MDIVTQIKRGKGEIDMEIVRQLEKGEGQTDSQTDR